MWGTHVKPPAMPRSEVTRDLLLRATKDCLLASGYAGLSTRQVAEAAGMPLSQIHYHFGSKRGLVLALLAEENARLLARQEAMYAGGGPLWRRWEAACDYLDRDLASGYVRVLQEMIAAGYSDPEIAREILALLRAWYELLSRVAAEAAEHLGSLGPFTPQDVAALVGQAFLGAEALILLGAEATGMPVRPALRRVGELLRRIEEAKENLP